MLGSVSETEDVLQDAYLKLSNTDLGSIDNPPAFITTVVSRLCKDRLSSRDREAYVGPWLPEPTVQDESEQSGAIHTAFLHLRENLNPKERAVFILKEAFDYDHQEVGQVLDITDSS
jgi:RNA polymerase sigma-70 factor (ECF subfamily)